MKRQANQSTGIAANTTSKLVTTIAITSQRRVFIYFLTLLRISISFFITSNRLPFHSFVPKASCNVR